MHQDFTTSVFCCPKFMFKFKDCKNSFIEPNEKKDSVHQFPLYICTVFENSYLSVHEFMNQVFLRQLKHQDLSSVLISDQHKFTYFITFVSLLRLLSHFCLTQVYFFLYKIMNVCYWIRHSTVPAGRWHRFEKMKLMAISIFLSLLGNTMEISTSKLSFGNFRPAEGRSKVWLSWDFKTTEGRRCFVLLQMSVL